MSVSSNDSLTMSNTATSNLIFYTNLEKLSDSDDYPTWKYAIEALLRLDGLWAICIGTETESDPAKLKYLNDTARARILATVEPSNYSHIMGETTAHGVWENLRLAFEDCSWSLRAQLVNQLIDATTKLEQCQTMEEYVQPVQQALQELRNAGVETLDDMAGAILLAGLDSRFDPVIRSLDNADKRLTSAKIRQRLMRVDLQALRRGKSVRDFRKQSH